MYIDTSATFVHNCNFKPRCSVQLALLLLRSLIKYLFYEGKQACRPTQITLVLQFCLREFVVHLKLELLTQFPASNE